MGNSAESKVRLRGTAYMGLEKNQCFSLLESKEVWHRYSEILLADVIELIT